MQFGSVGFFKVLIKTVLAVLFFVPLALAIVFGILMAKQGTELAEAEKENESLSAAVDVLSGENAGTVEDFVSVFDKSGLSYADLIARLNETEKIDAAGFYGILSEMGAADEDILEMIVGKGEIEMSELYQILSRNGITDEELLSVIIENSDEESRYKILSELGFTDEEIRSYLDDKDGDETEVSPYAELYPDMYVTAPEEYVREDNTVYLTFDDGPSNNTYSILQYLRNYNIKATFFVVPTRTEYCYTMLKAIAADGHAIGIHSSSHEYEKIYSSVEAFLEDFYDAWDMVYEATGIKCEIFRFPGGSVNDYNEETRDAIIAEMSRRGFRHFDWSVDSGDAAGASWTQMWNSVPADIAENYEKNFRSVVLMHDSNSTTNTVLVLEDILKVLTKDGIYKFDTINNDTLPVQFAGPFA